MFIILITRVAESVVRLYLLTAFQVVVFCTDRCWQYHDFPIRWNQFGKTVRCADVHWNYSGRWYHNGYPART